MEIGIAVKLGIIVALSQFLASGIFCVMIAREKHRDTLGWFFLGFLFGITALFAIIGLKDLYDVAKE